MVLRFTQTPNRGTAEPANAYDRSRFGVISPVCLGDAARRLWPYRRPTQTSSQGFRASGTTCRQPCLDDLAELANADRLEEDRRRAGPQRLLLDDHVGGNENDWHIRARRAHRQKQVGASHHRHPLIGEDQVARLLLKDMQSLRTVGSCCHLHGGSQTLYGAYEKLAYIGFILGDQNMRHSHTQVSECSPPERLASL